MPLTLKFKTSEQCSLELVATTAMVNSDSPVDFMPVSAARVSFGKENKTGENTSLDVKLMTYLADHDHMSPFEHQSATFLVECPLFIRSQVMRHRTFAYNEISRRYTEEDLAFWVPARVRKNGPSNRQSSVPLEPEEREKEGLAQYTFERSTTLALASYNSLLSLGVCREQARGLLPQTLLTKFYMTGSLRNWDHFIELRTHEGAQEEVQVLARRIKKHLEAIWPESMKALGE